MKKNLLILMTLATLTFFSCSKSGDDNTPDPNCTITAAHIAGSYKVTAISYKLTPTTPALDGLAFLDDCMKDDIHVLDANGNYSYNDAGTLCAPPGSYTGTWTLTGNNLVLEGKTFVITSFNCTTLIGKASSFQTAGDEATVTFTKQ